MFKESVVYTIEKALPKITSIIFLPIILRLVSPTLWAEIVLLLGLQLLFSLLLTFGNERAIFKYSENIQNFYTFLKLLFKYFLIGILIIEIIGQISKNLPFSLIYGLPIRFMLLSTFFITINRLLVNKLRVLKKPNTILISSIFESIGTPLLQTIFIFLVVGVDGFNTRVIVSVYFLAQLLISGLKTIYLDKSLNLLSFSKIKNSKTKLPTDVTKFANINFYLIISGYLLNWQDKYIVEYFFGYKELGIYGLTTRVSNLIFVIVSGIIVSGMSNFWSMNEKPEKYFAFNSVAIKFLGFISLSIVCFYISLGKLLVPSSYLKSLDLIFYGCIAAAVRSLIAVFTVQEGANNNLRKILKVNLLVLIIQLIGFFTLQLVNLNQIFLIQIFSIIVGIIFFFRSYINKHYIDFIMIVFNFVLLGLLLDLNVLFKNIILFVIGSVYLFISLKNWIKLNS